MDVRIMDKNLVEKAEEILKIAEENGVQNNFFFVTTFKRYQVQINVLNELEKTIIKEDMLVKKEYVKGRKNLYINPAVKEYNKTTDSANKTVAVLLKIIKSRKDDDETGANEDPLMNLINGSDGDEQ